MCEFECVGVSLYVRVRAYVGAFARGRHAGGGEGEGGGWGEG